MAPVPSASRVTATASGPPASSTSVSGCTPSSTNPASGSAVKTRVR